MISLTSQFAAWCRSKPADEEYDFWDHYNCACAQFGTAAGLLDDDSSFAESKPVAKLHWELGYLAAAKPWTFSALADRVERQLAEQVAL